VKRDKVDIVFSNLVRERANHTCECCGRQGRMEASHFYGRRDRKLRWHPDNASCLCHTCHRRFTENPNEHVAWYETLVGSGVMDMLRERHNDNRIKYSKVDLEDIYKHLKSEYAKMLEVRADGYNGRLEFEAYD